MRKFNRVFALPAGQAIAFVLMLLGAHQMAFAAGDGCNIEVRRNSQGTEWEHKSCKPVICDTGSPNKYCTSVTDPSGFSYCICPDSPAGGWVCKPAFKPDGGSIVVGTSTKPTGVSMCINWNCPSVPTNSDCPKDWGLPGTQQTLTCVCP